MGESNKMTPEEAETALDRIIADNSGDLETVHVEADGVLMALLRFLGHDDIVRNFESIDKWYA